jgi:hypothetical protein
LRDLTVLKDEILVSEIYFLVVVSAKSNNVKRGRKIHEKKAGGML